VKMSSRDVSADFKCSKCNAHYKVVRVKAETQSPNTTRVGDAKFAQCSGHLACAIVWRPTAYNGPLIEGLEAKKAPDVPGLQVEELAQREETTSRPPEGTPKRGTRN